MVINEADEAMSANVPTEEDKPIIEEEIKESPDTAANDPFHSSLTELKADDIIISNEIWSNADYVKDYVQGTALTAGQIVYNDYIYNKTYSE